MTFIFSASANASSNGSWDDWVLQDRIRKLTDTNIELAANLKATMEKALNPSKPKTAPAKKRAAGSDLSSARGSEERLTPVTGRGQKRGRDIEIEKVRLYLVSVLASLMFLVLSCLVKSNAEWSRI